MIPDFIERHIHKTAMERALALETVCEAALQGGLHGVLVVREAGGSETMEVSPLVPYGEIHTYPWGMGYSYGR